jgi:hypothetical protein
VQIASRVSGVLLTSLYLITPQFELKEPHYGISRLFLTIRSPKGLKTFRDLLESKVYCNVSVNDLAEELDKFDRNFPEVSGPYKILN